MKNPIDILIDVADLLAMGVPTSVLADEIYTKYDVEYALALDQIEKLRKELANNNLLYADKTEVKQFVREMMMSANPFGSLYEALARKLSKLEKYDRDTNAKVAEDESALAHAEKTAEIASDKRSMPLSKALKEKNLERGFDESPLPFVRF